MKAKKLFLLPLMALLLSACQSNTPQSTSSLEASTSTIPVKQNKAQTSSTTSHSDTASEQQFFDLPLESQLLVYASLLDERFQTFSSEELEEHFVVNYERDDQILYVQPQSDGSGAQPIYRLFVDKNEVEPLEGVVRMISAKGEDAELASIPNEMFSSEMLYSEYEAIKDKIASLTAIVTPSDDLKINYFDLLSKIQDHTKTPSTQKGLTTKELVLAAYLDTQRPASIAQNEFLEKVSRGLMYFSSTDQGYTLEGIQNPFKETFVVDGQTITCTIETEGVVNNRGSQSATVNIDDLNAQYSGYKEKLAFASEYLTVSSQIEQKLKETQSQKLDAQKAEQNNKIDTKNLTEQQAIDWVKNYWRQTGSTDEDLAQIGYKANIQDDGYLYVYLYTDTPTKAFKTLEYTYRINSQGELEEVYGDESKVVSREYIQ